MNNCHDQSNNQLTSRPSLYRNSSRWVGRSSAWCAKQTNVSEKAGCQTNPTKKYHMSMNIYLINKINWWIHGREYQRWIKLTGIVELFKEWKVAKPQIYHEPCDNHRRWINSITKLTRRVYSYDKWNWIHLQGRTYIMIINDMIEDKSNHRSEWMSN